MFIKDLIFISKAMSVYAYTEESPWLFRIGRSAPINWIIYKNSEIGILYFTTSTDDYYLKQWDLDIYESNNIPATPHWEPIDLTDQTNIFHENFPRSPTHYQRQVGISKEYITFVGTTPDPDWDDYRSWMGYLYKRPTNTINITGTVKTPQGYPVFKAKINSPITSSLSDKDGKYSVSVFPGLNTIWGEKTINKIILSKTAKEISELTNINADEEPNDNIP